LRRVLPALASLGLIAAAPPPFRIGVPAAASGPCAAPASTAPAGERAYFDLLNKRMGRPVLACPVASAADGAAGLAAGRLDMATLDDASYPAARAAARAAMTVRPQGGLARVPVVLAVKPGRGGDPQSLRGRTIAFGGSAPVALLLPRTVLAEQGYGPGVFGHELVAPDEAAALAALRAGKADAVALEAAAWQRQCRGDTKVKDRCADLRVVWRARPQAQRAFAVRRDLPDPARYRLLGVHLAMHMEDRPAFDWAAAQLAPNAADFEPAEAEALAPARAP
jgi:ABC-type phosphate/phosphonate transport system substrate-binding protein